MSGFSLGDEVKHKRFDCVMQIISLFTNSFGDLCADLRPTGPVQIASDTSTVVLTQDLTKVEIK